MKGRTILSDVAAAAGVHETTVSRALRDHPRISPAVRERIKRLAGEMGYTPDPFLRALAKYRTREGAGSYRGTLAWVTNHAGRDGWRHHEKAVYFEGASSRAAALGYDIETFWAREPGTGPARLRQILLARGVRGVLLPPPPSDTPRVEMPWEDLAVVSFGCSRAAPRLHSVHNHHYRSMELLLGEVTALGYRRPGLALTRSLNASVDCAWSGAYFNFCHEAGRGLPEPLIAEGWGAAELLAWRRAQRVDVVLTECAEVPAWLRAGGVRVPEDCGVALAGRHAGQPACAGIDENSRVIGETAAELLTSLVERGEFGVPANPQNVLIEGFWSPAGGTVRPEPRQIGIGSKGPSKRGPRCQT